MAYTTCRLGWVSTARARLEPVVAAAVGVVVEGAVVEDAALVVRVAVEVVEMEEEVVDVVVDAVVAAVAVVVEAGELELVRSLTTVIC